MKRSKLAGAILEQSRALAADRMDVTLVGGGHDGEVQNVARHTMQIEVVTRVEDGPSADDLAPGEAVDVRAVIEVYERATQDATTATWKRYLADD